MTMKWAGVTPEQYNKMKESVNWEEDIARGAVFHVAGFDKHGMHVTDIWESADDFNNFIQKRIMPKAQEAGIKGQPEVDIFPVHTIFAPGVTRSANK